MHTFKFNEVEEQINVYWDRQFLSLQSLFLNLFMATILQLTGIEKLHIKLSVAENFHIVSS